MKKRGFTIVELLVSMSIFVIIMTLAVGAYVSINRFRELENNINESQQKVRTAMELITRLSRQAQEVNVDSSNKILDLGFNVNGINPNNAAQSGDQYVTYAEFKIDTNKNTIYYYPESPCTQFVNGSCAAEGKPDFASMTPVDLLSGVSNATFTLNNTSSFSMLTNTIPLRLAVNLDGQINTTNTYASDSFKVDTEVTLENVGGAE